MKKELVLHSVKHSVSSIFTKEDVINLINSVEGGGRIISVNDIQRAIDRTIDWIENNQNDVVCLEDAEFEISYNNQLECTSVGINFDEIREALENNFMDFGEAEGEEVEEDDVVEIERAETSEENEL